MKKSLEGFRVGDVVTLKTAADWERKFAAGKVLGFFGERLRIGFREAPGWILFKRPETLRHWPGENTPRGDTR